jgi:hypothetical protein
MSSTTGTLPNNEPTHHLHAGHALCAVPSIQLLSSALAILVTFDAKIASQNRRRKKTCWSQDPWKNMLTALGSPHSRLRMYFSLSMSLKKRKKGSNLCTLERFQTQNQPDKSTKTERSNQEGPSTSLSR